jgi:AbiV family abortive infection protein
MHQLRPFFERHSGPLPVEQISLGISACIDNALDLFGDGLVLYNQKRYARALALLLTSLQEAGKVTLLRQMSLLSSKDQKRWSQLWKSFRDHETKDAFGQSAKISQDAKGNPGEAFWQQVLYKTTLAPAKEKIRQFALYVDFVRKEKTWWSPREITAGLVEEIIDDIVAALYNLYRAREMRLFSAAALRVYREEFAAFTPDIQLGKDYEIGDFGIRIFGINGPYKRVWTRLIEENILKEVPDDLSIMGKPWREWLMDGERRESRNRSMDSANQ